jgi:hypothetical protein
MRRTTILSLTAATVALAAVPAGALAHDGHDGEGATATPVATVSAFADGKLTLSLTDGSTLTAKVTDATRLACESATATTAKVKFHGRGHGHGGFGRHRGQRCGTDSLTAGTKVTDADVSVTTSGVVFREVDLLK